MRGGLRRLVHPGTPAGNIDVEGTRVERQRIHDVLRAEQALRDRLLAGDALRRMAYPQCCPDDGA